MQSERLNFHCPVDLGRKIKARGIVSDALRESLERYFHMLDTAREEICGQFSAEELTGICTAGNGVKISAESLETFSSEIEDVELSAKVDALTPMQLAALVDAVERFWLATSTGMSVDAGKMLG